MKCPNCRKESGRGKKFKRHVDGHKAATARWTKRRAVIDPGAQLRLEAGRLRASAESDLRRAAELEKMARRLKKLMRRRA